MISVERNVNQVVAVKKTETPCLSMRLREAAAALGICERTLWELTDKGQVPHIRLGKCVLYPVDVLRDWLQQQAKTNADVNSEE